MGRFCCAKKDQSRLHNGDLTGLHSIIVAPICRARFAFFIQFTYSDIDRILTPSSLPQALKSLYQYLLAIKKTLMQPSTGGGGFQTF